MYLPVAHGEGKFVADGDAGAVDVAVYYADGDDNPTMNYPENPSGSLNCIAGICDSSGHLRSDAAPGAFYNSQPAPQVTSDNLQQEGDGLKIFQNAVEWVSTCNLCYNRAFMNITT